VVATLTDEQRRERFGADEFDELVSEVELPKTVSFEVDPEIRLTDALTEREMTFFEYPAPPLHVIESAMSRGRKMIDNTSKERAENVPDQHRTYVRQRETIEAIVIGGRDVASADEDVIDRIHRQSSSERRYEDTKEYAEVVAFNAALAAESMLEDDGKLITPP
jgi:hypothetical protein